MSMPKDFSKRLALLMADIQRQQSRSDSLRNIAGEELTLACETLNDQEIEKARQKSIDTFTASLDNYIKMAKEMFRLHVEARNHVEKS